jgi:hypothetical protein
MNSLCEESNGKFKSGGCYVKTHAMEQLLILRAQSEVV